MKQTIISTSAGNTLTFPHETLPVLGPEGIVEKYVGELRRGDRVLYRGQYTPIELDQIVGVLYDAVEGYRSAREFCYIRDNKYEIPRLRYDIIKAVSGSNPELFSQEELQDLNDCIFRREGQDFSRETVNRIAHYMAETLDADYVLRTYREWVDGNVIHPEDFDLVYTLAERLESDSLRERAEAIRETPAAENPYLKLVAVHKITAKMLAAPKAEGKGPKQGESGDRYKERVFPDLPDWYLPVIERFGPMVEEGVVEVLVNGIQLVESREDGKNDHKRSGLQKGVIVFGDEERRVNTYQRLRIAEPQNRTSSLERNIQEANEIYAKILEGAFPFLVGLSIRIPEIKRLIGGVRYEEGTIPIPYPDQFRFLTSAYNYDIDDLINQTVEWTGIVGRIASDRPFKRKYLRESEETLPREAPMYSRLARFYQTSLLLQSLFSEKEFIGIITYTARKVDTQRLKEFSELGYQEKQKMLYNYDTSIEILRDFSKIFNSSELPRFVSELRQADERMPPELTLIRLFPHQVSSRLQSTGVEPERRVLSEIARKYGIAPEKLFEIIDNMYLGIAMTCRNQVDETNAHLKRIGEEPLAFRITNRL